MDMSFLEGTCPRHRNFRPRTAPAKTVSFDDGNLKISFKRTVRVPDVKEDIFQLPPDLGNFPPFPVAQYAENLPPQMASKGGVSLPMYQREAMWIDFEHGGIGDSYYLIKVHVGGVNAISGETSLNATAGKQDFVKVPGQEWLDGVAVRPGIVRQFVALPLGAGATVEGQAVAQTEHHLVRTTLCMSSHFSVAADVANLRAATRWGLGAGGMIKQYIQPTALKWDPNARSTKFHVQILNSQMFKEVTGRPPLKSPVSMKEYAQAGGVFFNFPGQPSGIMGKFDVLEGRDGDDEADWQKNFEDWSTYRSLDAPGVCRTMPVR
ncbi:hypothetical protein VTK56DRAFT_9105 [Thermocarpiscus australiensis]